MPKGLKPDKNNAGRNRRAGSAKEDCPIKKWIMVTLSRKKRNENLKWWPEDVFSPFSREKFSMDLTNGNKQGQLDQLGRVEFGDIPPGFCTFACKSFYSELEDWIQKKVTK